MADKIKLPTGKRTTTVSTRVTEHEYVDMRVIAKSRGLTVSNYLRKLANKACELPEDITVKSNFIPYFCTYMIGNSSGQVKIGKSSDVRKRMTDLQSACADDLSLLLQIKGDCEYQLHQQFASDRIHHEWFHLSEAIQDFIDQHK